MKMWSMPKLIEGQAVILLLLGQEVFQLFLEVLLLLFQGLDDVAAVRGPLVSLAVVSASISSCSYSGSAL